MSEKSHVGMGFAVCPVCGVKHDEVVLIDKQLKNTLERENFTGWQLCAEHQKQRDEGYVFLVAVKNETEPVTLQTADRTGEIVSIRASAWDKIFNMPMPPQGLAFCDSETVATLQQRMQEAQEG